MTTDLFVALEVVDQVQEDDGPGIACLPDVALEDPARLSAHHRKDMFHPRANARDCEIGLPLFFAQGGVAPGGFHDTAFHSLGLHLFPQGCAGVGAVGIHHLVVRADQVIERLRVMDRGRCHNSTLDQFAGRVDLDVVLVPVEHLLVLLGPAGVDILVGRHFRALLPAFGQFALFDRCVLLPGVPLPGYFNEAGIHDAAILGEQSLPGEVSGEDGEELLLRARSTPRGRAAGCSGPEPCPPGSGRRSAESSGGPAPGTPWLRRKADRGAGAPASSRGQDWARRAARPAPWARQECGRRPRAGGTGSNPQPHPNGTKDPRAGSTMRGGFHSQKGPALQLA